MNPRWLRWLNIWWLQSDLAFRAGMDAKSLKQDACESLVATFARTSGMSIDDVENVTREIAHGPWTDDPKNILATQIAECQGSALSGRKAPRANQSLTSPDTYFNIGDWDILTNSKVDIGVNAQALAIRLYSVGVTCPDNKSIQTMTALLI